ncbi:AMP-dependent synthetase [Peribacillus asahii]|uniref:acetate--CoA ligase n=1 Tax=Peribacillus asahii TaxID=228899 RepID=A0A398AVS8_9BACI|nr:AMP-binding protein [Peribacillus asahii]RID81721.1 AMP-dependent synthetase [Peribacillus asahii]
MNNKALWQPSQEFIESTRLYQWMGQLGFTDYEKFLDASTKDIAWFWGEVEKELGIEWVRSYEQVLNLSKGIKYPEWYEGGKINIIQSALEKWAHNTETANQLALVWESEDGEVKRYTYAEISAWVDRVAQGFQNQGIEKGDRIAIYMPMIPETAVAILAAVKIGAVFSPAFSGYGADALAIRLNAAQAKIVITADGFLRRNKVIKMKEEVDQAVAMSPSIEKVVVVRRLNREIPWSEAVDMEWIDLESTEVTDVTTQVMESSDPLMLIYTSGTTGKPKGAVHTHSGFPIKAAFDVGIAMDLKRGDTLLWIADMGWLTGPVTLFGSLLNGATAVFYEGSPDYPNTDRLWELATEHQVTHLGVSPTLIRTLMKHENSNEVNHNMKKLRVFTSTGEPWNSEAWKWLFEKVGKGQIPIINYAGGTEIAGGILINVLVKPISPITFNSQIPGMDVHILSENGHSVHNALGELSIKQPWVGMTRGFWQEPERYEQSYWNRWPDTWVHGDWAILDEDGFWTITGRSDDTLNVAGKRLGPSEMESILQGHECVLEAATIGVPDSIKGEAPVCFVVLKPDSLESDDLKSELLDLVAMHMGKAMRPKALYFISELPRTKNGKILRRVVQSTYLNKDSGDLSSLESPNAIEEIRLKALLKN